VVSKKFSFCQYYYKQQNVRPSENKKKRRILTAEMGQIRKLDEKTYRRKNHIQTKIKPDGDTRAKNTET